MSCNSMINTVLSTETSVSAGGTIPIGTAVHGYGKAIVLNGSGIALRSAGYYRISADVTLSPTAQGAAIVTANVDGTPIPGAIFTTPEVAAGTTANGSLQAVVLIPCACSGRKTITFTVDSACIVNDMSVIIEKE